MSPMIHQKMLTEEQENQKEEEIGMKDYYRDNGRGKDTENYNYLNEHNDAC